MPSSSTSSAARQGKSGGGKGEGEEEQEQKGVELEVVVGGAADAADGGEEGTDGDGDGRTASFVHMAGEDPYVEAEAFCTQHLPSADSGACSKQLVEALEDRLAALKAFETSATKSTSNGGNGGGTGVSSATTSSSGGGGTGGAAPSSPQGGAMLSLLGPSLLAPEKGAVVPTVDALKGAKVVALYFAADW